MMARMDSNRDRGGFLPGAPRLVRARRRRQALSRRRQVHHLHQQPLLRRVPARTCCARSSSARTRTGSPITAGPGWAARASATATTASAIPGEDRAAAAAPRQLGRPRLPAVDPVELRAAHGGLGPEQPDHAGRRRPRLHLVRHEQRLRDRAGQLVPRSEGDLQPRRHHDARPPAARRRHRLPAERRHRQTRPLCSGLGQARAGEHGDVPVRPHATTAWRASPPRKRACG